MKKKKRSNKGIVLIKKANQLIESRYKFDVWETRFFLTALGQIRKDDEDFKQYRIWYKDVIKTFSLSSNQSYDLLREAAQSLMQKTFIVNHIEDGYKREKHYHIIRQIDVLAGGQKGEGIERQEYIDFSFEPEMKPLLLQLQRNFTAYDLRNVVKLGTYPIRVYELLKQYETIGERTLKIDDMKRMFQLTNEYPRFANFFQKVIKPSIRDINEHTDLTITKLGKKKEGRKVVALYFKFETKKEEELDQESILQSSIELSIPEQPHEKEAARPEAEQEFSEKDRLFNLFHDDVVKKFGVTPSVFLELLDGCTEEEIQKAIRVTRRAKVNAQIKASVPGFFVHALKNNYTDQKEEEVKRKAEAEEKQNALQQYLDALQDEHAVNVNTKIKEVTARNPDITLQAIQAINENPVTKVVVEKKQQSLERPLEVEDYRKDKLLREMVKSKIIDLAKEEFSDLLAEHGKQVRQAQAAYNI